MFVWKAEKEKDPSLIRWFQSQMHIYQLWLDEEPRNQSVFHTWVSGAQPLEPKFAVSYRMYQQENRIVSRAGTEHRHFDMDCGVSSNALITSQYPAPAH